MSYRSTLPLAIWLTITGLGIAPRDAQAGPLLDWLFGRHHATPAYPVGPAVPVGAGAAAGYGVYAPLPTGVAGYAGNYGTYYNSQLPAIGPAGAGYTAPMPSGIAAATLPPSVSYVPNFQTQAQRAPVTYYRPLLTTDPNTGAQVVAMAPCTSYEYMAQRVPTWGRSALFGSSAPPVLPTQALPTYTLPSGGVPLAYTAPSITAPYSTAYGAYGTSGPAVPQSAIGAVPGTIISPAPTSVGPAGSYPTQPLGQSSCYGSTSGGSCGGYSGGSSWQGVPGLVAPPAPATGYPSTGLPPATTPTPLPGYGTTPSIPGTTMPGSSSPGSVYPPSLPGNGSSGAVDPGSVPPQLPPQPTTGASAQSNLRPQLRSITRQPQVATQPSARGESPSSERSAQGSDREVPALLPIPAPEDFNHQPRWTPPLLRDGDMTAMVGPAAEQAQLAGQSKPIQWASFETPAREANVAAQLDQPSQPLQLSPSGLRPPQSVETPHRDVAQPGTSVARPLVPAVRETGGWRASGR